MDREARLTSATLVDMQPSTVHPTRWVADPDESALLGWVADRSATADRHLVPVVDVGRIPDGRLVVEVDRPGGMPIDAALERLGTPTIGVAVTLSVPLLELVVAAHDGTVMLGSAEIDDVVVDDAGAVVLCDRPPGATAAGDGDPTPTAALRGGTTPDALRTLVLAARTVWDRVDPADSELPAVAAALQGALDGDGQSARTALELVRDAAPPRPFRWTPVPSDLVFADPDAASAASGPLGFVEQLRLVVEQGLPVGVGRRLPLRHVVVGAVVVVGVVVAGLTVVGGG